MVNKLRAIFFSFATTVLVLFVVFVFLMTTVNPPRDPNASSSSTEAPTEAPAPAPEVDLRKFMMDFTTKPADTFNAEIMSKGRRSIEDQRTTKNEGLVLMKVVDDEGRPRIEVVLYPRWADSKWKIYRMDNILDPKHSDADLLPNSIFMNEDTIIVENDEFSPKWDLNSYTTTKSVRRNAMAISLDSQEITKVDTISLPPEKKNTLPLDDHSPITNTAIKLNDIEQEQTQIITENINTENVFNILTKSTFSIATNKVTSPETITDDNITNVIPVFNENAKTETSDTSDIIEETIIFLEDSGNKSVTANSINQSVIDNISSGEDKSLGTSEISEDIPPDVESVKNFNDVTINAVSAESMMEQITELTTISLNTETETTTETTFIILEDSGNKSVTANSINQSVIDNISSGEDKSLATSEILEDIPPDVDSVKNFNDVIMNAVSAESMMEQITEVTTISLNTKTETTTETTILETTNETTILETTTE